MGVEDIRLTARYVVHLRTPHEAGAVPGDLRLEGVMMSDVPFELLRRPIELELEDGRRWSGARQVGKTPATLFAHSRPL